MNGLFDIRLKDKLATYAGRDNAQEAAKAFKKAIPDITVVIVSAPTKAKLEALRAVALAIGMHVTDCLGYSERWGEEQGLVCLIRDSKAELGLGDPVVALGRLAETFGEEAIVVLDGYRNRLGLIELRELKGGRDMWIGLKFDVRPAGEFTGDRTEFVYQGCLIAIGDPEGVAT